MQRPWFPLEGTLGPHNLWIWTNNTEPVSTAFFFHSPALQLLVPTGLFITTTSYDPHSAIHSVVTPFVWLPSLTHGFVSLNLFFPSLPSSLSSLPNSLSF